MNKDPGQPKPDRDDGTGATWTIPWDTTVDPNKFWPGDNHGWIVQEVKIEVEVRDEFGRRIPHLTRDKNGDPDTKSGGRTTNVQDHYLEAWRVESNARGGGGQVRAGEEKNDTGKDTFQVNAERPGTYGRVVMRGKAAFINGSKQPVDPTTGPWNRPSQPGHHKKDPTYVLPSTRDKTELAKFDAHPNKVDHWMVYEWDTRDRDQRNHTHQRSGGLGVPPPALPPLR